MLMPAAAAHVLLAAVLGAPTVPDLMSNLPAVPGPVHAANPLAALPSLLKVHHSTAMSVSNASDPVLQHYARITHSLGLSVYWASEQDVRSFAAACRASDDLPPVGSAPAPRIPCSIAANYNPWGEDGSPFPRTAPPTQAGSLEAAELELFRSRLGNVTTWLATANTELKLQPPVMISVLLLDSERFGCKGAGEPGAQAWNAAITRKNNLFLTVGRQLLPSAEAQYYSIGGLIRGPDGDGWGPSGDWFTLQEETDIYAVSLCAETFRCLFEP